LRILQLQLSGAVSESRLSEAESLLAEMRLLPNVKLAPDFDGLPVTDSMRRALERAVFQLDEVG
jgi:hypothetical protein